MRILVACEESQRVTTELRKLGHSAYSCDLVACSGGFPEWHIQGDVLPLLNGDCSFSTMDGKSHKICGKWDMIIAFPPCTYLTIAGTRHFSPKCNPPERIAHREKLRESAAAFFLKLAYADCERIAIENPVGYMSKHYKKPTQIIEPYFFAESVEDSENYVTKRTCLWLKGLPPLKPTKNVVIDGANIKAGNNKNVGIICNEVISYAYPATEGDEFFSTGNSRFVGCKVLNCKITADGADNVGGICGFGGAVSDCMASGITFSGGENIGGIVGNAYSVTGCLANNITANGYVKSAGGIAGTAYGVKLYNDGDKARYSGGNIIGCGVRTFTSTADNSGGIVGTATADNSSAFIKSCYVANIYLNGKNNGGIAGADGNKTGHKITYCLVDNSNNYPVIGGDKVRSTAKTMILSVPADTGLTVEGVLSVLNANASSYSYWERSDSINGGYPYPKKIDFESLTAERK